LRKKADLVFSLVVLLLAGWMVWQARAWQLTASLFPFTVGIPAIALALLQCGFALRRLRQPEPAAGQGQTVYQGAAADAVASAIESAYGVESEAAQALELDPAVARRRTLEISAWIVAFAVGVLLLGFRLGAFLLPLLFLKFAAREGWRSSILLGLVTYVLFYGIFVAGLHLVLPPGQIADSLGLDSFDSYAVDPLLRLLGGH